MATDSTVTINPAMEKVAGLLEQLATKLGVDSDQIWAMTVAQAKVEVITYIAGVIILIISSVICIKISTKIADWDSGKVEVTNGQAVRSMVAIVIFRVIGFIALLGTIINFGDAMSCMFNPDYWAFEDIMWKLRNLK